MLMGSFTSSTLLDVLTKRARFLDILLDDPKHKYELVEATNVSRSTVDRAVRELEVVELIERSADGFRPTLCGKLVYQEYSKFNRRLDAMCDSTALLSVLPNDAPMDLSILEDAKIWLSEAQAPMKPIHHLEELLANASSIRGLSPVVLPRYVDLFYEQTVNANVCVELVLESRVISHLTSRYTEQFNEALQTARLTIQEFTDRLPFGLLISDSGKVGVVVYEEGTVRGVILNETDAALEWAENAYERYYNQAESISLGE